MDSHRHHPGLTRLFVDKLGYLPTECVRLAVKHDEPQRNARRLVVTKDFSLWDSALRALAAALPRFRHLQTLVIDFGPDVSIDETMSEQVRGLLQDGFFQNRSITNFRVVGGGTVEDVGHLWSVPRLQHYVDRVDPDPPVGLLSHMMARNSLGRLDYQTMTFLILQRHADRIWALDDNEQTDMEA